MDNNPTVVQQPDTPASKNMMWLVIGLIMVILLIAGAYWYLREQQTTTTQPTPKPAAPEANLESELNSIDVESAGSDFTSVDADLNNL